MCIHLFARDQNITLELLHEQIWLQAHYAMLEVREVYDVIVRNNDVAPIDRLFAFCPYFISDISGDLATRQARRLIINPDAPDEKYNWYFVRRPKWIDQGNRTVSLFVGSDRTASLPTQYDGVLLGLDISIPKELDGNSEARDVLADVDRTLLELRFDRELKPGELGIFRLQLRPSVIGAGSKDIDRIVKHRDPTNTHDHRFVTNLQVASSDIIIGDTVSLFDEKCGHGNDSPEATKYENVRIALRRYVRHAREGFGSVRIERHILSIIPDSKDLAVTQDGIAQGTFTLGSTEAQWNANGKRVGRRAHVYYLGSEVNNAQDVVHNANRIIDFFGNQHRSLTRRELVDHFAVGDRHEVMSTLIDTMKETGILKEESGHPELWCWGFDAAQGEKYQQAPNYISGMRQLRRAYDNPQERDDGKGRPALFMALKNLHPFGIGFHVAWEFLHESNRNRADEAVVLSTQALDSLTRVQQELSIAKAELAQTREDLKTVKDDGKKSWILAIVAVVITIVLGLLPLVL